MQPNLVVGKITKAAMLLVFPVQSSIKKRAMKEVYVFKTSVKTDAQIRLATLLLDTLNPIVKIDFDPEDCDNILRIESNKLVAEEVIKLFNANGLYCEELN